jgi:hypothetical protein
MMADHEKMMADVKAADEHLDGLVAKMNDASGQAKVDATAATVTEIVAQRKTMRERMMGMQHEMMTHMMEHMQAGPESMAMCPMMKMKGMKHCATSPSRPSRSKSALHRRRSNGERRSAFLVERHQLTVNNGVVGQRSQRLNDGGAPAIEIVVVARSQVHGAIPLKGDGAVAVQLELVQPRVRRDPGDQTGGRSLRQGARATGTQQDAQLASR